MITIQLGAGSGASAPSLDSGVADGHISRRHYDRIFQQWSIFGARFAAKRITLDPIVMSIILFFPKRDILEAKARFLC